MLHRSLASMCRSGVPLPDAFRTLAADISRGRLGDAVGALASDVEDGMALDAAYRRHADALPPAYGALIGAGLASGDLPAALDEIALHAERRARAARAIRAGLAGPLVSAVVVLVVGCVVAIVAGPRLASLTEASIVTSGDVGAGGAIAVSVLAFLATAVLVTALVTRLRGPLDGAAARGSWALRVPVIGPIRLYSGLASALGMLAALLRRGVALGEAFDLVAATSDEPRLRADFVAMAHAAHDGAGLEASIRASGRLPPSQLWLLRAAEERGHAAEGLADLADLYAGRLERAVDRAATLVGPTAELVIGACVFLLAYAYLIPLLTFSLQVLTLR